MTKLWMIGGTIAAVSVALMVWDPRPARPSEDLLRKAQSEFAIKARDAVTQRYMAQSSTAQAAVASRPTPLSYHTPPLEPVDAVAPKKSLEPIASDAAQRVVVAPAPELTKNDTSMATAAATAPEQLRVTYNAAPAQKYNSTETVVHRNERSASRSLSPHELESLRARSPELAAAIVRYM